MNVFTPVVNAFRVYNADGTEATSTPAGNQDANVTVDVSSGDVDLQFRALLQETAAVSGSNNVFTLQRDAGAGYTSIAGATAVQAATSGLTNDGATTNRATNGITGGTGSFVAGVQSTDGNITHTLTASNFTEHVWGIKVVAADVSDAQTIPLRIAINGGSPGMTNNVALTITIQKVTTHATSGAISGPGSEVSGSAAHIAIHTTTGEISGSGAIVAGSAAHIAIHPTEGEIVGPGAVVEGAATRFRAHDTTGAVEGPGAEVSGSAAMSAAGAAEETTVKTGTGGIDRKRRIYKPTGLEEPKKKKIEERLEETRQIHAEVLKKLADEISEPEAEFKPIPLMTEAEINREIGFLMKEVQRKQDEEDESTVLLLLMLS